MPGAGAGIGKVQRSDKALHLTGRATRRGYVTDHRDCTFSITEAGMIPEITPLNMVLDDRILVVTAASPFDLLLEEAEEVTGRGERI